MQSRGRPSSFSPLDIPELKVERGKKKELFKEWWKKGILKVLYVRGSKLKCFNIKGTFKKKVEYLGVLVQITLNIYMDEVTLLIILQGKYSY